jgi:outer membrane protein OmpA-like peptidoglycan-associated protein
MPKPSAAQATVQPAMAKPAPSPQFAPPGMTADQKATQERLTRQLAEIRSRAASPGSAPPAPSAFAGSGQELSTIVISSQGIISEGFGAAAAQAAAPADPSTGSDSASRLISSPTGTPGNEVKVATILFENDSHKLKALDKRILSAVVRLQRERGGQIRIVGHASSRTRNLTPINHKMVNFKISVNRANRIAAALVRLGVNKKNIQIAAVSDSEPAFYEFMPSGEAGNRRTEVYLTR